MMAPESERAITCRWCDKPIHKVRRYNSVGNEYFEQWAHELDDDATCTLMVEPNEPTLACSPIESKCTHIESGCSEVVERLQELAYHDNHYFDSGEALKILHSWRERRVQELENLLRFALDISDASISPVHPDRIGEWRKKAENTLAKSDEWREQIRKGAKHD